MRRSRIAAAVQSISARRAQRNEKVRLIRELVEEYDQMTGHNLNVVQESDGTIRKATRADQAREKSSTMTVDALTEEDDTTEESPFCHMRLTVKAADVTADDWIWLATAQWHGLKWKAIGDTPEEAVEKAKAAASTEVWVGKPMADAPGYLP